MNILPCASRRQQRASTATAIALEPPLQRPAARARRSSSASGRSSSTSPRPRRGCCRPTVERIDDLGRVPLRATSASAMHKLAARVPPGFSPSGDTAGLVFDPARVHVYADSLLVEGAA